MYLLYKALLRPGRLDRIVYVPLPDEDTRREILQLKFRSMPIDREIPMDWLVSRTRGYSGAEVILILHCLNYHILYIYLFERLSLQVTAVCNEAALRALEENIQVTEICRRHFEYALTIIVPRITKETMDFYEKYVQDSGVHAI